MLRLWSKLKSVKHIDKVEHFVVCFLLTLISWEFAAGWGIGKETGDYFNPNSGWSWGDLVADGLGIGFGLLTKMLIFAQ